MTDEQILLYYSNLLISQYAGQPNAVAQIQAFAGALVLGQVFTAVQNAYQLGTAEGAQLDILGKYIGASRNGNTFQGPTTLDDSDYLTILQLAAIRNQSDGSLDGLLNSINTFFDGVLQLYDYKNMSMSYFVDPSAFSTTLAEFAINAGLFPKPQGVRLGTTTLAPIDTNFYGWLTRYNTTPHNQSPFATRYDYSTNHPWLNASYGIGLVVNSNLLTEDGDILETESGAPIALE